MRPTDMSNSSTPAPQPKKKKKIPKGFQGPFKPGTTNPNTGVRVPTPPSAPIPTYLQKPKQKPVEREQPNLLGLFSDLSQRVNKLPERDQLRDQPPAGNPFQRAAVAPLGLSPEQDDEDSKRARLQSFLNDVANPRAPLGYNKPVGKNFRSDAWNKDHVQSELADATNDFERNRILTDQMEQRFDDAERYMLYGTVKNDGTLIKGKLDKRAQKITDALKRAEQGTYDGDFDVLRKEMEDGLKLEMPSYRSEFGVTPKMIWKAWEQERENLSPEDRANKAMYTIRPMMEHYAKLQDGYRQRRATVQKALERYETKYGENLKRYEDWSGEDQDKNRAIAKKAGPAIPDITPKTSKEDQELMDQAAGSNDLVKLLGAPVGDKATERVEKSIYKKERSSAKTRLGVTKLPTIKEMLSIKVHEGTLDPEDDKAVEQWIERFKDPNHPDTRLMYAAFAKQQGNTDDKDLLKYVNEPVKKYVDENNKRIAAQAEADEKFDADNQDGFFDTISDVFKAGLKNDPGIKMVDTTGGTLKTNETGVTAQGGLSWTFDKLARPLYALAGMYDAITRMDEDTDTPWHGQEGFLGTALTLFEPGGLISSISGQSLIDSVDEIIVAPEKTALPFKSGYEQFFRGSSLPGIDKDIVPTTFAQIIANGAASDPDGNLYDKEWYQHVAGFVLDAGLDPLNFVGVGVVDDIVKLPSRVVRDVNKGEKQTVLASRILDEINLAEKGPISNQTFRVNEVLRKYGDDQFYTTDAGIYGKAQVSPVGPTLSESAIGSVKVDPFKVNQVPVRFRDSAKELRVQMSKSANDNGVISLTERVNDTIDPLGSMTSKVEDHLRVNKLEARLGNLGHNARTSLKVLARGAGKYSTRSFPDGSTKEFTDAVAYIDEGGKLPNEFSTVSEYNRASLRLPDDEPIGSYHPGPIGKSLRDEYASAMGYTPDKFPFSEAQVYESLVQGPRLARKSDPVFRARWRESKDRIARSMQTLKTATKQNERNNALTNLNLALRDLRTDLYGSSLRYLDEMQVLKSRGMIFSDRAKAMSLKARLDDVSRQQETADLEGSAGVRLDEDDDAFQIINDLTDEELLDPANPIYTEGLETTGLPKEVRLNALAKTLARRINRLRLDKDGRLTGFPPREAHDVSQLIPAGLRKPDGTIDRHALESKFVFHDQDYVRKVLKLDPYSDAGKKHVTMEWHYVDVPKEHSAFAEIIRGGLQDEYRDAYIMNRAKLAEANRTANGVEEVSPVGNAVSKFIEKHGEKPQQSDPIKPSANFTGTEWAKKFPEGFSSRQDLMEYALQGPDEFYDALYSAGAPFKIRSPKRINFVGESPKFDEPSMLRDWAMKRSNNARDEVDRYMKQVARENYEFLTSSKQKVESLHADGFTSKEVSGVGTTELNRLFNDAWNATLKKRIEKWKEGHHAAKLVDDAATAKAKKIAHSQAGRAKEPIDNAIQLAKVRRESIKASKKAIFDSIIENQTVPRSSANERLTINETARAVRAEVQKEYKYKANELKIQISQATTREQAQELKGALAGLTTNRNQALKIIEKGRVEAHETKKILLKRYQEESILQVAAMPTHMSTKAVQIRFMGMRKNFQTPNGLFAGAAMAEKLLPATTAEKFANYFVRPTKQLTTQEAITFRAIWEGQTPVIIKANLSRMSHRMGKIQTSNRVAMFDAYRRGRDYLGPQSELYAGVKQELDDLESMVQGENQFYFYRDVNDKTVHLPVGDVARFMKKGYGFNSKAVLKAAKDKGRPVTLDDIYRNIVENNPKADINDPFRFAWVMRLAADQARQTGAIHNLIATTFGVRREGVSKFHNNASTFVVTPGDDKARVIERLKSKGWETVKELGDAHYFPPESVNDIRKLLEFMKPEADVSGMMKKFDTMLGYWKQGATIYNPGYYTRNGMGEIMASWLDGVNNPKYYRQAKKVMGYMKSENVDLADLMEKWSLKSEITGNVTKANEVLFTIKGGHKVTVEEILRQYTYHGLKSTFANTDISTGLRSVAKSQMEDGLRKTAGHISETFHNAGEGFEDWLRMSHFIHAMEHSGAGSIEKAAEYAASRVRKYHFDYTDFSKFEQSVMLRAFPFYKWTRRGAPLMLAHLFLTPGKMTALPKAMDALSGLGFNPEGAFTDDPLFSTQDVHDDMNGFLPDYQGIAPAWVRDLFAYQMNPAPDDEYANYFRVQTPMIDGLNAMLNPTEQAIVPLLNPAIKMPIELGMNRSMDPDSNYQIIGGQFNEMNQINPAESAILYAARSLNPVTGFLAKLSKNGDLPGESPFEFGTGTYQDQHGRESRKDWASFLTGLGFYQGKPKGGDTSTDETTEDSTPVGHFNSDQLNMLTGVSPIKGSIDSANPTEALGSVEESIKALLQGSGLPTNNYSKGSGWKNFGYGGYRNYRRFSNYYGGSSGGSDFNLLEFLQRLARQIDQGQVYKGDLDD